MSYEGKDTVEVPVTLRLAPAVAEWLTTFSGKNGNTPGAEVSLMVFHTKNMVDDTDTAKNRKAYGWR